MEWIKKLWSWVLKGWNWLRTDGLLHLVISALIVVLFASFCPVWAAVLVAVALGAAKEVYDRVSGKGTAEWHDVICDGAGIVLGVLICVLWIVCKC